MLPGGLCMSDMKNKMKTTLQKQKYTHKLFFYRFYTTMKTSVNVFFFLLLFTLKKMWEIQKCEKINKMWYVSLPFWQKKKKSNLIALKLTHWRKNMINSTSLVGYTWINKWLLLFILSYSNVGKKKDASRYIAAQAPRCNWTKGAPTRGDEETEAISERGLNRGLKQVCAVFGATLSGNQTFFRFGHIHVSWPDLMINV